MLLQPFVTPIQIHHTGTMYMSTEYKYTLTLVHTRVHTWIQIY